MEIRFLPSSEFLSSLEMVWGKLSKDETLADLLRAEITARNGCRRWVALHRLEALLAPYAIGGVRDRLADLCESLEEEGDLSGAAEGILYPTPLRVIRQDIINYRILSSYPSHRLASKLPGKLEGDGSRRFLRLKTLQETQAVEEAIRRLDGLLVTIQEWAGLALAPPADEAWLKSLEQRLLWHRDSVGRLERDGTQGWAGLILTEQGPRWHRVGEIPSSRLWQSQGQPGRRFWAWGEKGKNPSSGSFVSLTQDEARRTVFALANEAKKPVQGLLTHEKDGSVLRLRERLPFAEYRSLCALGEPEQNKGTFSSGWRFPLSRVQEALQTIRERLGVEIKEESFRENSITPHSKKEMP